MALYINGQKISEDKFGNGTVALPSIAIASDPDNGIYRIGANNLGFAIAGVKLLDLSVTGLTVVNTATTKDALLICDMTGDAAQIAGVEFKRSGVRKGDVGQDAFALFLGRWNAANNAFTDMIGLGGETHYNIWFGAVDTTSIDAVSIANFYFTQITAAASATVPAFEILATALQTGPILRVGLSGAATQVVDVTPTGVQLADGLVTAPSLTFILDPDSGLYRIGANNLGIAVNGAKVLDVSATALGVTGNLNVSGSVYLADGSEASPSLAFTADLNTGLTRLGADGIGVVVGGVAKLQVWTGDAIYLGLLTKGVDGAVGGPAYSFNSDPNTGMYWVSADHLGFAAGGAKIVGLTSAGLTISTGSLLGAALELPHVVKKAASANARHNHAAEASTVALVYTKIKTITFTNGLVGQQRFNFDLKTAGGGATATARIYRNGVALGTEQTDLTGGYVTKTEDLTQTWNPGDTAEIWAKTSDEAQAAYVQNFTVGYDDSATVAVASANS